jgi:hypothetical protein
MKVLKVKEALTTRIDYNRLHEINPNIELYDQHLDLD